MTKQLINRKQLNYLTYIIEVLNGRKTHHDANTEHLIQKLSEEKSKELILGFIAVETTQEFNAMLESLDIALSEFEQTKQLVIPDVDIYGEEHPF